MKCVNQNMNSFKGIYRAFKPTISNSNKRIVLQFIECRKLLRISNHLNLMNVLQLVYMQSTALILYRPSVRFRTGAFLKNVFITSPAISFITTYYFSEVQSASFNMLAFYSALSCIMKLPRSLSYTTIFII